MDNEGFKQVEYSIPESPGVYRYFDKNEALLYVGKAKNLRKRVSQYFLEQRSPNRIRLMVRLIHRIEFTVVDTEHDALLLENVLIKKLQPRYNIRLKDDKTYPFLVLRNEHFPRLEVTRKVQKDGARYFGPYTSPPAMYTLLELVRRLYPLRTCALLLSPSNIKKAGYRPCLEYQLGNCKAPCAGLQNEEEYREHTEAVHQLLKGNLGGLIKSLRVQLQEAVKQLAFEEAHRIKEQVEMLEKYQARSTVVSTKIHDLDAYALARHRDRAVVNHLHVLNGAVVRSYNLEFRLALEDEEDSSRLMAQAMLEIAERYRHEPREIVCNVLPDSPPFPGVRARIPASGDPKKLVDLSLKNAFFCLQETLKTPDQRQNATRSDRLLLQVQKDLQLKEVPSLMECFDNSHFQGSQTVSSCVVFRNGRPSKRDYRLFNQRDSAGIDDFASMHEVITRRYSRILAEGGELPGLVVIDGGKGQLSAAREAMTALGLGDVPLIGIAKRLEALFRPGDPHPLMLDKKSPTLRLLQQMRDEAHRFGLNHHRRRRSKSNTASELVNLPGVGPVTVRKLLEAFGSAEQVYLAGTEALAQVVGPSMASKILAAIQGSQDPRPE